jgi:hypothetical protein
MPSPGNKSPSSALSSTVWFLKRPNFIEGIAAFPPVEKAEVRKCWRRERNWARTFSALFGGARRGQMAALLEKVWLDAPFHPLAKTNYETRPPRIVQGGKREGAPRTNDRLGGIFHSGSEMSCSI